MLPRPEPRDEFRRALRGRLMAEARTVLVPREPIWRRFQRLWLRPAVAFAAVALLLTTGTGIAAAGSLPGDPAFALKRAAEDVQLALTLDDGAKLRVLAEQADHRLAELSKASTERATAAPTASAAYAEAVAKLTTAVDALRGRPDADESKREAAKTVADSARAKHEVILNELQRTAPADAQDAIEHAKRETERIRPSEDPAKRPGSLPTKSPERTVRPTETPEAGQTAKPTGTPKAERTAEPTRTPEAGRTAEPTETPKVEQTSGPTETPKTGQTAKPTKTPETEPTSAPTTSPEAGPTSAPTETRPPSASASPNN